MTVTLTEVLELIEARKNIVLTCAEIGMSESQFKAYRKVFLDQFGKSGLESELKRLFSNSQQQER